MKHKLKLFIEKIPLIYKSLVFSKYLFFRYVKTKRFKSYYLFESASLNKVASENNKTTFFGYYNITPQNDAEELIYLTTQKEKTRASQYQAAKIIYQKDKIKTEITEVKAWNWQQGNMLQWLHGSTNQIIFNDFDSEKHKYISKVVNVETNTLEKIIDQPIYVLDKSGEFALTLNFERLANMRPDYGYFNKEIKSFQELPDDKNDGIWKIDLATNKSKLIISLNTLKNNFPTKTMQGAQHKVNHIDIAPNGKRFMFLHRWQGPKGRFMRLVTANTDGTDIQILNGDIMTSHSCWLSNEEILSFCEVKGEKGYFKFKDKTDNVQLFSKKMPKTDGHPTLSPDGNFIITDTYPDKSRFSTLFLYDINKDEIYTLGKFFQPLRYNKEIRIDLHPKWSPDRKSIYFESGHAGRRNLYQLKIEELVSDE